MADDTNNNIINAQAEAKKTARAFERLKEEIELFGDKTDETRQKFADLRKEMEAAQDALEKETKALKEATKAKEELKDASKKYNEALKETGSALNDVIPGLGSLTELFKRNSENVTELSKNLLDLSDKAANKSIASSAAMAKELEKVNVEMAKQSGYATALRKDIVALASSQDGLYLSVSEGSEIIGHLTTGFRMYNAQTASTRKQINALAGRFKILGADAGTTAEVLDQMNTIFGNMPTSAAIATAELENLSIRTGQPLASVLSDFKDLGPEVARFGTDGVRVFTRLNEKARTLGLTTRQAFDISELFDTFEGSADVAGKLNAQLGLQLNSVEMMAATSEDRLDILRAEFEMRGVNMQQMGRRHKQMVAEILKTDVLTAERLLGDPMALREFQREQENNEDRIKRFTTAMDKFQAAAEQLFVNMSPLLNKIMNFFNQIAEAANDFTTSMGPAGSYMLAIASGIIKAKFAMRMFGIESSVVLKRLLPIVGAVMAISDVMTALGYGESTEKEKAAAKKKSTFGLGGAAIGGLIGARFGSAGLGASAGYVVGSLVGGAIGVEDRVETGRPGVSHLVTPVSTQGVPVGPSMKTHAGDGISALPRSGAGGSFGSFDDLGQKLDQIAFLLKTQKSTVIELDGKEIGRNKNVQEGVMKPLNVVGQAYA